MSKIYLTSDTHFWHDREFIWRPRGFSSVEEMNEAIIERWNSIVTSEDTVYHLGDVMLGDTSKGMECLQRLNGNIIIIRGNHDTDARRELYYETDKVQMVYNALYLKYQKYHFFLCHFPTMTGNLEKESLKQMTLNLFGHTHSKDKFYQDIPYMYNVACDAHDCYPVLINNIIEEMKNKAQECKVFL